VDNTELFWGFALTVVVIGVLGAWFAACGHADKARRSRHFARRTLVYAGIGFVLGLAFLTSDLGTARPEGRLGAVAVTVCCFLLLYAAGWGLVAANDNSRVIVNLTGRPLLLADPALAPFYTLPAPRDEPATELPPMRPRTYYVVSSELGRVGAQAGRTDVFTVDAATSSATRDGPVLVRRLLSVAPASSGRSFAGTGTEKETPDG
jgi:hypothetical protein